MSERENEHELRKGSEEAEEVREILKAVSEFIESLKQPIKEFIDMMMSSLDGQKLGEDVAKFYKELKSSGVPDELAKEMVKEFFRKRLESAPDMRGFIDALRGAMSKPQKWTKGFVRIDSSAVDEAVKLLKELKELKPEKAEEIDKIIVVLGKLGEKRKEEEKE